MNGAETSSWAASGTVAGQYDSGTVDVYRLDPG